MRSELRSDADQSGSEDEARGSDSPLLGDQGEPASPSGERSGLWTGGAQADSGSPSRADPEEEDGLSLHSLTGLERLFSGQWCSSPVSGALLRSVVGLCCRVSLHGMTATLCGATHEIHTAVGGYNSAGRK